MGRAHLTDDERLRVRVLRLDAGWTFSRIEQVTGYGARQIRNAMRSGTVGKRSGRPTALSPEQEAELIRFVTANKDNRSMSYANIAKAVLGGQFGEYAIRNTLRRNGFKRSGPVLKQVVSHKEEGTPVEERVSVAGAPPVGAQPAGGPMEGVTAAEPGVGDEYPSDDEMLTEDEGAGEQVPRECVVPSAGGAAAESGPAAGNGAAGVDASVARDLAAAVNTVKAMNEQPARGPASTVTQPADLGAASQSQAGQTPTQYAPQASEGHVGQTWAQIEMTREPSRAPSSYQMKTPREPPQAPSTLQMGTPREPSQGSSSYQTETPRAVSQAPSTIHPGTPREPSQATSTVPMGTPQEPSQAPLSI